LHEAYVGIGSESAVATAIFLILELNQPFSGLLHVPTMSIEVTLKALETPLPKG
jgi:hypothetical protein